MLCVCSGSPRSNWRKLASQDKDHHSSSDNRGGQHQVMVIGDAIGWYQWQKLFKEQQMAKSVYHSYCHLSSSLSFYLQCQHHCIPLLSPLSGCTKWGWQAQPQGRMWSSKSGETLPPLLTTRSSNNDNHQNSHQTRHHNCEHQLENIWMSSQLTLRGLEVGQGMTLEDLRVGDGETLVLRVIDQE